MTGLQSGVLSDEAAKIMTFELLEKVFLINVNAAENNNLKLQKRLRYHDIAASTEQLLLDNISENLSLDEMAQRRVVSPFHLCRIFKLINGVSILEFKL